MSARRVERNPFQVWMILALILSGVVGLLPVPSESTIDRVLSPPLTTVWYTGLILAGVTCAIGTLLPLGGDVITQRTRQLNVERVGMWLLGALLLGYGLAIEIINPALPSGVLLLSLAGASGWRVVQIKRELRTMHVLEARLRAEMRSP